MKHRKVLIAFLATGLVLFACNTPFTSSECSCAGSAINVQVVDAEGSLITPDSIKYIFDKEPVYTLTQSETGTLYPSVGSHPGDYTVWVYYKGEESERISTTVKMAGPEGCRRPSTKMLTFHYENETFDSHELAKIGGCSE